MLIKCAEAPDHHSKKLSEAYALIDGEGDFQPRDGSRRWTWIDFIKFGQVAIVALAWIHISARKPSGGLLKGMVKLLCN